MKAIRIFLLVLIIIGIGAIITQNIWVPKLVNKIIMLENTPTIDPILQTNLFLKNGRQCYSYKHDATTNAPYATTEFIDMTINGSSVIGTKTGTQKGPDMNNAYQGTLEGTLDKNTIITIFSYKIEGSQGKEKEIYKANETGLEKLRYPLIEEAGILVPDTAKKFNTFLYSKVGCTFFN